MRSLKLSGLIRSNPDRPTLKQRAAALRATAAKVIRPAKGKASSEAADGLISDLHAITGGTIHDDGMVSFCDAAGAVHRKPVADWIGFTASRLYVLARKEMARQVSDPSLDDADRAALAFKLRRDLRLDALHILACRSFEAFDLTQTRTDAVEGAVIPEFRQYRAGPVSMDLQRAVEAHREARQMEVLDPVSDADRCEAHSARIRALADAIRETPARSHADLRHKAIYLWPGNIEGETVSEDLSESLISIFHDIERLGSTSAPEGDAVDPILAAIEASRAAEATMAEWQARTSAQPGGFNNALFAEERALCAVQRETRDTALSTVPTTHAGRLALVEYVQFVMGLYGMGEEGEGADNLHVWKQTHTTLMAALAQGA